MTLGEKIRELREAKGYSQKQFAELLGCSQVAVSHWETNDREPSWTQIMEMCKSLQVGCEQFASTYRGETKPEPSEKRKPGRPKKGPKA